MTKTIFEYEMKVRDYECDVQGHVNNANYQHYFEVTRHEFLEHVGLNFYEMHQKGIDAVVSRVEIRYKVPLIGMDKFKCTIALEKKVLFIRFINVSFDYQMTNYAQKHKLMWSILLMVYCLNLTYLMRLLKNISNKSLQEKDNSI